MKPARHVLAMAVRCGSSAQCRSVSTAASARGGCASLTTLSAWFHCLDCKIAMWDEFGASGGRQQSNILMDYKMTALDDDQVLDAKAAACFLGIAVATLAKMRCKGGSPAFIKAGRKVLYLKQDLISWQNARRVINTTAALSVPRRLTKNW